MGELRAVRLDRHANHLGRLARGEGLSEFAGLDREIGRRSTVHWAGASLRFDEHEFRVRTTYGELPGANLLDWPITLAEMVPWYAKAEDKMGVTRTNNIPGLPGNNNFKVLEAGARATTASHASRSDFVSRVANPAPSGRRFTPKCPRAKRPAISRCGPTAWR
jgi:hypothetical protein